MSVRSILNHVLHGLDLTWTIRDGALVITTPEEAESRLSTRVIDVVDLISPFPDAPMEHWDYDSLIELFTSIVAPQTWDSVGGPAPIEAYRGGLVLSQTHDVFQEIDALLRQLRAAREMAEQNTASPPPTTSVGPSEGNPAVARINRGLDQFILLEYSERPLHDVAEDLSRQCNINVVLDVRALDDVGIAIDVPVSFRSGQIRVRHALRHMLRSLDLTTVVRDEALVITTPEEAECRLVSAAYPMADLLGPKGDRDQFGVSRRPAQLDHLVQLTTDSIARNSWDTVGGPGSIATISYLDVVVISQTDDVHNQIADLFTRIRRHLAAQSEVPTGQAAEPSSDETRLVVYAVPSAEDQSGRAKKVGDDSTSDQSRHAVPSDTILSQMGMGGGMGGMGSAGPAPGNRTTAAGKLPQAIIPEDQLLGTIMKLVEPSSWVARNDVYAEVLPGRLLIRHTEAVHRKIEQLLVKLGVPFSTGNQQGPRVPGGIHMGGGMF
jgi:hypothetical protein